MATPRTRKTTPATENKTAAAPDTVEPDTENKATVEPDTENKATAESDTENKATVETPETESGPQPPDVAPLEPPAPPQRPVVETIRNAQQVLPAQLGDTIVDEATGAFPTDPDAVFVPVTHAPYGNVLRCTVRLIENIGMGPYRTPSTRLLVPAGAEMPRPEADRIVTRLRAQLAAQTGE
jgi:hypothetical protein